MENKLIKAGGLWKGEDKNGNTILTGSMGGVRIVIFANTFKEKPNQPDFNLFFGENKPKDKTNDNPRSAVRI